MALSINQTAPDFTLPSTNGENFTLSVHLKDKPCILYFYPKDFTPGCTKEACEFRDAFAVFRNLDITVLGVSRDSVQTHLEFKKAHSLPYELLADTQGTVAELYKAIIPLIKVTRRTTYLLDSTHTIVAVYENMFDAEQHIQVMIEKVKGGTKTN
jgi:peroxiredoxin Q/BCP